MKSWSQKDKAAFLRELADSLRAKESLVTLGIAPEDSLIAAPRVVEEQYRFARDLGLRITHHANSAAGTGEVARILAPKELLGPDVLLVHMNHSTNEEWRHVAESGASVVFTPGTELQMGIGLSSTELSRTLGMAPTIGVDIVSNTNGDMFSAIRLALQVERGRANEARIAKNPLFSGTTVGASEALRWATVNGAAACGMAVRSVASARAWLLTSSLLMETTSACWAGQARALPTTW